jgi:ribosomal protein S18 acetylase RimI-like enzyme
MLSAALRFKREQLLAAVDASEPVADVPRALALSTPSLPRVWELNVVLAPGTAGAERLIDAADAVQARAGLAHRRLRMDGAAPAEPLRAAAAARGWRVERELVMVREPAAQAPAHAGRVEEVGREALAAARDEFLRTEPYGDDPETRRQLIAQHERWARGAAVARSLGVVDGGRVVAWCSAYDDGELYELDDVAVLPGRRGEGLGRELVAGATALAPPGRVPFLLADADDWPRHLYERLGFTAVGERVGVTRRPSDL